MGREKEVEEMASDLNNCITEFVTDTGDMYIDDEATAQKMFDKGYRKIVKTDWLTKGISKEQLEREKDESLKEFLMEIAKKYGYYKQSEVAKEIFDDLKEKLIFNTYGIATINNKTLCELKKKYTEELLH